MDQAQNTFKPMDPEIGLQWFNLMMNKDCTIQDSNGNNLLTLALRLNVNVIDALLERNINANHTNQDGQTALHFVHCWNNEDQAKYIFLKIALKSNMAQGDIDKADHSGATPIDYAFLGRPELGSYLYSTVYFNKPKSKYSIQYLMIRAVQNNGLNLLKYLIAHIKKTDKPTFYINFKTTDLGHTPLMLAAINSNQKIGIEMIILLLENGADISATDKKFCSTFYHLFCFINKYLKRENNDEFLDLKKILLKRINEIPLFHWIRLEPTMLVDFQQFLEQRIQ